MPRLGAPFPQRNASFGRRGPGPKLGRARSGVCPRRRRSAVEMRVDAERAQVALGEAAGEFGRGFADGIEAAARAHVGAQHPAFGRAAEQRSEEHTSELQSLMRISYAVFCLKKKN